MNELAKIDRVISRELPDASRETLLVLDATTGQNAVHQAEEFNKAAELTGIDVTAYKIKAFVLSAVYCGVAGCLYAMMIKYVSPDTFVSNTSSVILWTAIVGGFGSMFSIRKHLNV